MEKNSGWHQFSSVLSRTHHSIRIVGGPDVVVVGEQGHYQLDRVDRVSIQIYTILACIFISTMGKSSARAAWPQTAEAKLYIHHGNVGILGIPLSNSFLFLYSEQQ